MIACEWLWRALPCLLSFVIENWARSMERRERRDPRYVTQVLPAAIGAHGRVTPLLRRPCATFRVMSHVPIDVTMDRQYQCFSIWYSPLAAGQSTEATFRARFRPLPTRRHKPMDAISIPKFLEYNV